MTSLSGCETVATLLLLAPTEIYRSSEYTKHSRKYPLLQTYVRVKRATVNQCQDQQTDTTQESTQRGSSYWIQVVTLYQRDIPALSFYRGLVNCSTAAPELYDHKSVSIYHHDTSVTICYLQSIEQRIMSAPTDKCFYEVLGVAPHTQKHEIKNAYRRLALRFHPDKNTGDPNAKAMFQEIQMAYEVLSDDDKRSRYDTTARFLPINTSKRTWREPSYEPCRDPPFWSVELREMTVQKCTRITKIQQLEREIRDLVFNLNKLVDAENIAVLKGKKCQNWFPIINTRPSKANAQRHHDFLMKSACIHSRLNVVKDELRTAHEDHNKLLERDNKRKAWWARERVRRAEEENRRAATTKAEAARRRAERERECGKRDPGAARAEENLRRKAREEWIRIVREARVEEERRKRDERVKEDPEGVRKEEREAREWVARQREEMVEREREGAGTR